ncbi:hypothetical protein V5N11_009024 [Cardamine amara subsp. amara]|uniref:Aspartic peptidase DDI1-type domain-containing protein n=1 Tax=Cardamine amara subsp. amara TaxID=228776 RepID=A0ABD1C7F5_CARAN
MMKQILDGQIKNAQQVSERISTLDWKVQCLSIDLQREVMKNFTAVELRSGKVLAPPTSPKVIGKGKEQATEHQTQGKGFTTNERMLEHGSHSGTHVETAPAESQTKLTEHPNSSRKHVLRQDAPASSAETPPARIYSPTIPFPSRAPAVKLRHLPKLGDPGKFVVPCSILGVEFEDSLCDSGSTVNVMSKATAQSLGIENILPSPRTLKFADGAISTSQGLIKDLEVRIDDCLMPCDFQVVEMRNNAYMPLILGRPFLATAGAIVDLPQNRVSLAKVSKGMFYVAISDGKQNGSYVVIEEKVSNKTVLSKSGGAPLQAHVTLTPQRHVGDAIEYKSKCKGMSKPFSKIKALITPELKAQGQAAVDAIMNRVLKFEIKPPPPPPDPPADPPSQA